MKQFNWMAAITVFMVVLGLLMMVTRTTDLVGRILTASGAVLFVATLVLSGKYRALT